jgi:hypothetical protein
MTDTELVERLKAALAEPCVAVRLVHAVHGGCADFDVLDLLRLVRRVAALEKVAEAARFEHPYYRDRQTTLECALDALEQP